MHTLLSTRSLSLLRPLLAVAALALCITFVSGCSERSDDAVAVDTLMSWLWNGDDFFNEDENRTFTWNSGLTGVNRVEVKVDDFTGTLELKVIDGSGAQVYDETFFSEDEANFREVKFTNPAVPGSWQIQIEIINGTGDVRVAIDDQL